MVRLDQALVARGLAPSRTRAAALITDGHVRVGGRPVTKPGARVGDDDDIELDHTDHYVSRAAHKLIGALDALELRPYGRALDAGASTGGFTQVLLERGVTHVHAVDVGHDQLHPSIREDPRVSVHERFHLRDLTLALVDDTPLDWLVADVSFISLTKILEPLFGVLAEHGQALLMVKPQFEVGRTRLGAGGVVRAEDDREQAIAGVISAADELGWTCRARTSSPVPGEYGNREEFVWMTRTVPSPRPPILNP